MDAGQPPGGDDVAVTRPAPLAWSRLNAGTLPASWATTFPQLSSLNLLFNMLTGTLPPVWGAPNAWRSLQVL